MIENDRCEMTCYHDEAIDRVKKKLIKEDEVQLLSEIFKVLGDTTRVKILNSLAIEELCVCDLAEIIGVSQSAISHQLRVLRNLRLVKYRKDGKMVYYSLDDEHILHLFKEGLAHIRHS